MANGYGNAANAYKNNTVNYASKEQLLLMILDGAVKFTKRAIQYMEENKMYRAHENIVKVQGIFYELMASLDCDTSGEWGKQLLSVYEFIIYQTTEANIKKDINILREVLPIIEDINETWNEAYKLSKR